MNIVSPQADWIDATRTRYRQHFESLPDLYFLKGMERLEALRGWSQGRATQLRPASDR
jgi:hypothetical protein